MQNVVMYCRLQVLVLCGNGLSNNGIQKMTAPVRVMQKGPLNLHSLDLSGFHLTYIYALMCKLYVCVCVNTRLRFSCVR